jgi:DNA-directed RNA polymerase specialized sigma24 family protein
MEENPNRELLDRQDWGDIHARLLDFATHRTKPDALAKDLVQDAISRVYAYEWKWDPAKEPDLVRYLMSVVNGLLANERTSAASRRTKSMSAKRGRAAAEAVRDDAAFSETRAVEHDLFTRRMTLLTERLAGNARALKMVELMTSGIDTPAAIRKVTGWSADETMATRRAMLRAAARVAQDIGGQDDDGALAASRDGDDEEDEEAS